MFFTNNELCAILKLALVMANADGKVSEEESAMMCLELLRFGVDQDKVKVLAGLGDKMSNLEACKIVSNMNADEKKYVTAYLGAIICADGNIDDSELKAWAVITALCDLPTMSIGEAIQIMSKL